ncbi:OLC1v1015467C1 [Oldenlandia corymbosa var. corymbosa]|uniref:OLC1v1015467C1 n=1 Tax=Oldenlandia corymbosa var. corymbosa TaxID=529605 RepID=A0AAV1E6L1_OLDCO|nr:OLC1v1015467C1 [Oldenlandia corymbosa var. corymbosa]
MAKGVTFDFQPEKCVTNEQQVDRISQLPNEILVDILSLLTLEDAAKTSVLSKRWIDLWLNVDKLDFDSKKLWKGLEDEDAPDYLRFYASNSRKYVEWVNKVVQSHKATTLDAFRIRFDLTSSFKTDIDNWVHFAYARRVHMLDLDFSGYDGVGYCIVYNFPNDLLGLSFVNSSAPPLSNSYGNDINSGATSFGFKSLRTLAFNSVGMSGEVLEFFLHNCPFLESLRVELSDKLENFRVCGPSLALKHLEIMDCFHCSITVCNTNIVSLKTTQGQALVLQNVPMLVDVEIGGFGIDADANLVARAISWLSCCISKLEILSLRIKYSQRHMVKDLNAALPQLTQLKLLTFHAIRARKGTSLIKFTSLIKASPNLEKFVMKTLWCDDDEHNDDEGCDDDGRDDDEGYDDDERDDDEGYNDDERDDTCIEPFKHLKVVEFWGYCGSRTEIEFVEYFVEKGYNLERLVIDSRELSEKGLPGDSLEMDAARKNRAKTAKIQLNRLLPQSVELVII